MKFFTQSQLQQLRKNHAVNAQRISSGENVIDFKPVVKLFAPWGRSTWLLTELDDDNIAYGLCDVGWGTPELGYVSIAELQKLKGPIDIMIEDKIYSARCLPIERELSFVADKTISEYARIARAAERIIA